VFLKNEMYLAGGAAFYGLLACNLIILKSMALQVRQILALAYVMQCGVQPQFFQFVVMSLLSARCQYNILANSRRITSGENDGQLMVPAFSEYQA